MKTRYNSLDHFLENCTHKTDFSLYMVDTLPDHPAHFWGEKDYNIDDLYLVLGQDGGNKGPYTIYLPLQIWSTDSDGNIEFDELNEPWFRESVVLITFYDYELERIALENKENDDFDFDVAIYKKD